MRLLLTILISLCLASPAYAFWGVWRQPVTDDASSCSDTATVTYTGTNGFAYAGYSESRASSGNQYGGSSTYSVCKVTVYAKEVGDVSTLSYDLKIRDAASDNANLGSLLGTSDNTVAGSTLNTSSFTAMTFTFSTPVTFTTYDVLDVARTDRNYTTGNYIQLIDGQGLTDWGWNTYYENLYFYTDDNARTLGFDLYEPE